MDIPPIDALRRSDGPSSHGVAGEVERLMGAFLPYMMTIPALVLIALTISPGLFDFLTALGRPLSDAFVSL